MAARPCLSPFNGVTFSGKERKKNVTCFPLFVNELDRYIFSFSFTWLFQACSDWFFPVLLLRVFAFHTQGLWSGHDLLVHCYKELPQSLFSPFCEREIKGFFSYKRWRGRENAGYAFNKTARGLEGHKEFSESKIPVENSSAWCYMWSKNIICDCIRKRKKLSVEQWAW